MAQLALNHHQARMPTLRIKRLTTMAAIALTLPAAVACGAEPSPTPVRTPPAPTATATSPPPAATQTVPPIPNTDTPRPTVTPRPTATECTVSSQAHSRIAYSSDRADPDPSDHNVITDIWVMNADGSGQTRLTESWSWDENPSWSPDGLRVAFSSHRAGEGRWAINVINADGFGHSQLSGNPVDERQPSWSPDGLRIAFSSAREDLDPYDDKLIRNIYLMNADGSGQTRLTDNETYNTSPSWSPDGRRIVFQSVRGGNADIYVMNADGSDQTRLTEHDATERHPSWSPDGSQIAFASSRGGDFEIYVMNADGSGEIRLTANDEYDDSPSWSPDGRQIAYKSTSNGTGIYVMNADGSCQTRLTRGRDASPSWSNQITPSATPPPAGRDPN